MATDFIASRTAANALVPASAMDAGELGGVPIGTELAWRVWAPRTLKLQRFYRGMLALVNEATGRFPSPDALHVWLKIRYGLVDQIDYSAGKPIFIVRSTAFDQMDQGKFREFVSFAIDVVLQEILPGVPRDKLVRQIESMAGVADPREVA